MPPHLHPRSAWTTSLFTTTLLASFLVVGVPHLLPCPVGPRSYAEGEMQGKGTGKRRKRRPQAAKAATDETVKAVDMDEFAPGKDALAAEMREGGLGSRKRDCPMPRPKLNLGQMLGVRSHDQHTPTTGEEKGAKEP